MYWEAEGKGPEAKELVDIICVAPGLETEQLLVVVVHTCHRETRHDVQSEY